MRVLKSLLILLLSVPLGIIVPIVWGALMVLALVGVSLYGMGIVWWGIMKAASTTLDELWAEKPKNVINTNSAAVANRRLLKK